MKYNLCEQTDKTRTDDGVWGWQWHQLDHMQTVCTLLQTDNHTKTSSLNFYRPDALPDANQQCQSTEATLVTSQQY